MGTSYAYLIGAVTIEEQIVEPNRRVEWKMLRLPPVLHRQQAEGITERPVVYGDSAMIMVFDFDEKKVSVVTPFNYVCHKMRTILVEGRMTTIGLDLREGLAKAKGIAAMTEEEIVRLYLVAGDSGAFMYERLEALIGRTPAN